jgi:hypothetical protein
MCTHGSATPNADYFEHRANDARRQSQRALLEHKFTEASYHEGRADAYQATAHLLRRGSR